MQPPLNIREGLSISDIIHHDDPVSPSVICASDGPEALLPRSVPYL